MHYFQNCESTLWRYMAWLLLASIVASIHLGWAAIVAGVMGAIGTLSVYYAISRSSTFRNRGSKPRCPRRD